MYQCICGSSLDKSGKQPSFSSAPRIWPERSEHKVYLDECLRSLKFSFELHGIPIIIDLDRSEA